MMVRLLPHGRWPCGSDRFHDDPACAGASRQVSGSSRCGGTRQLVVGCQGVTFENEWVNIDALIPWNSRGCGSDRPSPPSPLVNKLSQRSFWRIRHRRHPGVLSQISRPSQPCRKVGHFR